MLQPLIAGAILPLAFAPLNYWPLAFISIFLILHSWLKVKPKLAFIRGLLFGISFFGVGVSWVFVSIHRYGNTNIPLAAFITAIFILFLSFFPAIQAYIANYYYRQHPKACLLIAYPASWVLMECFRGWFLTGFPWLYLGYTQLDTPLAGFAPVIGVYGISFLTIFSISLIMLLIKRNLFATTLKVIISKSILLITLVGIWITGYFLNHTAWTTPQNNPHQISLIQGNVKPNDKFMLHDPIAATLKIYAQPMQHHLSSEFIIWPENSIPLPLPLSNSLVAELDKFAAKHKVSLLLGIPTQVTPIASNALQYQYYNSLLALGKAHGIYHKKHLVPFGEYLPLDKYLRGLINFFDIPMSNFIPGPKQQALLATPKTKLLPLICYEIAYPEQVRDALLTQQSEAILTISEDGWFGNSWGPHQHLAIARMRALENGRYVVRSTTSGISAIINEKGRILKQSPQFKPYVLTGKFIDFVGTTPWTKYGQWPLIIFCGLLFLVLPLRLIFRKNQY